MAIRTNWDAGDVLTAADLTDTFADARTNASNLTAGTLPIGRIADGAVVAGKLASNAVTTVKINDGAVTTAKLATAVLSEAWATPTIASGWTAADLEQPIRYKKIGNILYVAGAVKRTGANIATPMFSTMATLPVGFRPATRHVVPVVVYTSSAPTSFAQDLRQFYVRIETNGNISLGCNDPAVSAGTFQTNKVASFSAVVVL